MSKLDFIPDNLAAGNLGIENNNPGNLVYVPSIEWQGQTGENNGFAVFSSMDYGYRALIKNLQAYINRGQDTINKIFIPQQPGDQVWAPPGGNNNPESYAKHASERTGISRSKKISAGDLDALTRLAAAISTSEIGTVYPDALARGASMVTANTKPKLVLDFDPLLKAASMLGILLMIDNNMPDNKKIW